MIGMSRFPKRPRGVRKHWKREVITNTDNLLQWDNVVSKVFGIKAEILLSEVVVFSFKVVQKRVLMVFQNDKKLDVSFHKNGGWIVRMGTDFWRS